VTSASLLTISKLMVKTVKKKKQAMAVIARYLYVMFSLPLCLFYTQINPENLKT
jgi:hypothetical protein